VKDTIKNNIINVINAIGEFVSDGIREVNGDKVVLLGYAVLAAICAGALGLALILVQVAKSDGHVTYCQVLETQSTHLGQASTPYYVVIGHRDWQSDLTVASAETADEAARLRDLVCP
jgi:hypothetical protein